MNDDEFDRDWIESFLNPTRVEPSADMREAAKGLRGFYLAMREQGFDPSEALTLTMRAMTMGQK